jgi:hypothetical protein
MKNIDNIIDMAIREIKKDVLPTIKLKEPVIYIGGKKYLGKYLGFNYINNKINKPIMRLNCSLMIKESKKIKTLSLYEIILTTILHELAHASQEIKGKPFNEEEAENFAYDYWATGTINKI